MMFTLSIIHSQIVSTHTGTEKLPRNSKTRRSKIRRRRVHYSNRRSRNISPETKSSESSIDLQNENAFRDGALRRLSSEQLRMRKNSIIRTDILSNETPEPRKKSNKIHFNNNVRFNLNNNVSVKNASTATPSLDDDGFESFNGYGSSENGDEAVKISPTPKSDQHEPDIDSSAAVQDLLVVEDKVLKNEIDNIPICGNDYSSGEQSDMESDPGNGSVKSSQECTKRTSNQSLNNATSSTTEYLGITTNSEECSYSSEYDESDSQNEMNNNENIMWDYDLAPTVILSPSCAPSDRGLFVTI